MTRSFGRARTAVNKNCEHFSVILYTIIRFEPNTGQHGSGDHHFNHDYVPIQHTILKYFE